MCEAPTLRSMFERTSTHGADAMTLLAEGWVHGTPRGEFPADITPHGFRGPIPIRGRDR